MSDDEGNQDSANVAGRVEYTSGLEFVAKNKAKLRSIVVLLCAHWQRLDLMDDIICDVIYGKAESIFGKYDPLAAYPDGTLYGFMLYRFRQGARAWFHAYCRKFSHNLPSDQIESTDTILDNQWEIDDYIVRKRVIHNIADAIDESTEREISALFDLDECIQLMNRLPADDAWLIRQHCQFDFTFEEIANKIGGAVSTIRVKYNQALDKLRRIANESNRNDCD